MVSSKLENEASEKAAILTETEALKEQLAMFRESEEKERRKSQVLQEEIQRFQVQLQEKDAELDLQEKEAKGKREQQLLSEKKVQKELDDFRQELEAVKTQAATQDVQLPPRCLFPPGACDSVRGSPDHASTGSHTPVDFCRSRQPANGSPSAAPPPITG